MARAGHARPLRSRIIQDTGGKDRRRYQKRHHGLENWMKRVISALWVAGLRGLSAVRIGHPMI